MQRHLDGARPDTLDDALERLDGYSYLDGGGFPVHGPMGAEALSSLGLDDLVGPWIEGYKVRHAPIEAPPAIERLTAGTDSAAWPTALGDFSRIADWAELFRRQLAEASWDDVVRQWMPRLLPGYGGGLTHGLIRTAHAVRALPPDGQPSPRQTDELAKGLALWAATYTVLPGRPRLQGTRALPEAITWLPRAMPGSGWTPMEAATFGRMDELADFPRAVEALAAPPSIDEALSDLSAAFCRVMLAHPDAPTGPLVHMVTPIAASRTLLEFAPEVSTEQLYAQLWHVGAGLVAGMTQGTTPAETAPATDGNDEAPTEAELVARAADHQDPHVVKFTEAALREHARRPDPAYLRAADHVITHMPPW